MYITKIFDRIPLKSLYIKVVLITGSAVILVYLFYTLVAVHFLKISYVENPHVSAIGAVISVLAGLSLAQYLFKRTLLGTDDRFILRRAQASECALTFGSYCLLGLILYHYSIHSIIRWDLILVLIVMFLAETISMAIYSLRS